MLCDVDLSLYVFVGGIMLVGIVKKNVVMMTTLVGSCLLS